MGKNNLLTDEIIVHKIYAIRGKKVMIDSDLALLYGVETKVFNQSVKRNIDRFPGDFMFQLTDEECKNLRSHFVTSSWGGSRYKPNVFTEQGVAMLSGVLKSKIAIQVNIKIIRVFTKLREQLLSHKDILLRLEQIENQVGSNTKDIHSIFQALRDLLNPPTEKRVKI